MHIIDFHTHIFPDHLAGRTIAALEAKGNVKAAIDGTLAALLASMETNGIVKSVVCSIATKPSQFTSILAWSRMIRSEAIIPFPSFHPADPAALDQIRLIRDAGFRGVKLHPFYQEFAIDDVRLFPAYEELERCKLIVMFHAGHDIGYPATDIASPRRIRAVADKFPGLEIIATHIGGWQQWDETEAFLMGQPVYLDVSFSLQFIKPAVAIRIITNHCPDYILFGSDSPWADQKEAVQLLCALDLDQELERKILFDNAQKLLIDSGH